MLILILLHNNVINVLGGLYMMLSRDSVPLWHVPVASMQVLNWTNVWICLSVALINIFRLPKSRVLLCPTVGLTKYSIYPPSNANYPKVAAA